MSDLTILHVSIPPDYPPSKVYNPSSLIGQFRKILQIIDPKSAADNVLAIFGVASDCFTYVQDTSTAPPLDGKRLQSIKKDLFIFVSKKATLNGLFRMTAQTILLTQSYKNFYELATKDALPFALPHSKILIALSNLFLIQEEFFKQVSAWKSYQKGEEDWESLVKITKSVTLMTLQLSQLIVFLPPFQMLATFQFALSTVLYGLTIYDIFLKECAEVVDLKKELETPPQVLIY